MSKVFFCCQNKKFKEYSYHLNLAEEDLENSMDIVMFMRRQRARGLGMTILLDRISRNFLAGAVKRLPIKNGDEDILSQQKWNKLESLNYSQRILAGVLSRAYRVENLTSQNIWFDKRLEKLEQ